MAQKVFVLRLKNGPPELPGYLSARGHVAYVTTQLKVAIWCVRRQDAEQLARLVPEPGWHVAEAEVEE